MRVNSILWLYLVFLRDALCLVSWYTAPGSANGACASQGLVAVTNYDDCVRYAESFWKANRREAGHSSQLVFDTSNPYDTDDFPSGCSITLAPNDVATAYPFGLDSNGLPVTSINEARYNAKTNAAPTQTTLDGVVQICTLPTVQDGEEIACGAGTGIVGIQFRSVDGNSCLGSDNSAQQRYEYGPLELADPANAQDSCGVFESQLRLGYDAASGTHTISSTNTSKYLLPNSDAFGSASVAYNKKFYFGSYPAGNANSDLWKYDITPITPGATQYYVQPKPMTSCKNGGCTQTTKTCRNAGCTVSNDYTRAVCLSTYATDGTSQVGWDTRTRDCEYTDFQKFTIECLHISPSAPPPPPIQPYYSTGGDCQHLLTEQDCRTLAANAGGDFTVHQNSIGLPPGCYRISSGITTYAFNTKTSLSVGTQCVDSTFYSCYCAQLPPSPPSPPPPVSPPHHGYTYISTLLNRVDALANCESMGGRLAILDTQTKFDDAVAVKPTSKSCWIGGQDFDSDSIYRWDDGSLVSDGYQNWQAGHSSITNGAMLLSVSCLH